MSLSLVTPLFSRSTDNEFLRESAISVREEGIITFAVGVGEANENELRVCDVRAVTFC